MVIRVKKFRSRNLFGETRKQEETRLSKEKFKAFNKGKTMNIKLDAGTTKSQKAERKRILRKSGLSTRVRRFNEVFK